MFSGKSVEGSHQFDGLAAILKFGFFTIIILLLYFIAFGVFKKFFWWIPLVGICFMIYNAIFMK
jgi:hypothetical protein